MVASREIVNIQTDLTRLRESINRGHLPEQVYANYVNDLEDPWKSMVIESHKKEVLDRLREF